MTAVVAVVVLMAEVAMMGVAREGGVADVVMEAADGDVARTAAVVLAAARAVMLAAARAALLAAARAAMLAAARAAAAEEEMAAAMPEGVRKGEGDGRRMVGAEMVGGATFGAMEMER